MVACLLGKARAGNWMGRLPDATYVAVVSIPGAHDAATGCGWAEGMDDLGDAFARTQELSLAQLWSEGVRAFDLRPCAHEGYLNVNHGLVATKLRFDEALFLLRDSLAANPTEFVVIHMLHETDGDQTDDFGQQLLSLLGSDELKDVLVDFKPNLTVGEMRGKMLLLSRDKYADTPATGGFFENWTGEVNWSKQSQGRIKGPKLSGKCYMQDYSDTHQQGGIDTKLKGLKLLLNFSSSHATTDASSIVWVVNLASAYSLVESLFGYELSLSDGYRDNATYTHAAILEHLAQPDRKPGPTGIVLMDYAGIDKSGNYEVRGKETVRAIIDNNFRYLDDASAGVRPATLSGQPAYYSLRGQQLSTPRRGEVNLVRQTDGSIKKARF